MRITVTLDEELVATAIEYSGIRRRSALITKALTELVQREAASRLAKPGGTQPDIKPIPRRRPPHFHSDLDDA